MKRTILAAVLTLVAAAAFAADSARTTLPILDEPTLTASCAQVILDGKANYATLENVPIEQASVETILNKWDDFNIAIENVIGPVAILAEVHPDQKTRDAGQDCLVKISSFTTELFQNEKLYQRVAAVKTSTPVQERFKTDLIEAFEDSGVALPADKRKRAKEIFDRIAVLSTDFGKNIRENNTKLTFTPAEQKGLPQSYIDRTKDKDGNIVVGFDYPDFLPFMTNADNEKARERYYTEYQKRGTPKNLGILDEVTTLRKELASLYGYPSFAHYVTKRRMSETPDAVNKFLAEVKTSVDPIEKTQIEELRKLKSNTLKTPLAQTKINRWDVSYWREKLTQQKYAIDEESTRRYFPPGPATDWLLDLTSRVYGIKFEKANVPVWHEDVVYLDVKDAKSGDLIGGVYLDLYPREGKYKHAAAWPTRGGSMRTGRKPISVLVTNFDRKGLTFGEVETFFHEFGHVMHGVLSETEYNSQAGTATQRDFVEAPSQMYEEWSRRPNTLAVLAEHCKDCPKLDEKTVQAVRDAANYGKGIDYARQYLYAAFDMALAGEKPQKSLDAWKGLEGASLLGYVPGTEFPGTFAHLTGGYAAGYYGYMWSEVIGKDMVTMWGDNLLDPAVGLKFRKTILARGGEQPAKKLVETFLGRPVSSKAFFDEMKGKTK